MNPVLLRALLGLLGWAMSRASRKNPAVASRITRNLVIQISTDDGIARHWSFDAATRTVTSHPGLAPAPDAALRFDTVTTARHCMFSRHGTRAMSEALAAGKAHIAGNGAHVLWFGGLMQKRLRRKPLPDPYRAHDPASGAAQAITIEPPLAELDPSWAEAWERRAKLLLVRVPAGEPPSEF